MIATFAQGRGQGRARALGRQGPGDGAGGAARRKVVHVPSTPGSDAAIGVFDSGVGGLTVARALLDQLPGEPLLYVGTPRTARTVRCPSPTSAAMPWPRWTRSSSRGSSCS